jgi:tRNA 2-thiouridine synthesizing protein A
MNFVKAKLFIDKMNVGQCVEILLDPGEPFENVTASVQEEGHVIKRSESCKGGWHKVVVCKS